MRSNKFLLVIYVLTFLFVLVGSTFAYFSSSAGSAESALLSGSSTYGINLLVSPLYTSKALIPTNDDDIMKAYNQECVDDVGYGACQAYTITVENNGITYDYFGTIRFETNKITNLNYLILDENDQVYVEKTAIVPGDEQSLGETFNLLENTSKVFKLLVWVPNYDYDQNDDDGAGMFNASVSYRSAGNYTITGTISHS